MVQLLNKKYFVDAFGGFFAWLNVFGNHEPSIKIWVVNNRSDTLEITSEAAQLFSLPWKLRYKGKQFHTFDSRINSYLKTKLSGNFNYYEKLLGGELIFTLIEQKTIDDQEYQNPLK
jgi:hypothetical protein